MYFKLGKRHRINVSGEIIVPSIVLAFVISYYIQVLDLSFKSLMFAAPLLVICCILSLLIIFRRAIKIEVCESCDTETFSTSKIIERFKSYRKTIATMLLFLAFLIFVEEIGFLISGMLYLMILMYFLGEKKLFRMIIISITLTIFVYSIFQFWFRVPLPRGILKNFF